MNIAIPESSLVSGFLPGPGGAHASRTLMLDELARLLEAAPGADYPDFSRLILEENVLLKRTGATRKEALRRLRELYGLKQSLLVFRAVTDLWPAAESERPLLALLCAVARDSLLRATVPLVLEQPTGATMTPQMFEAAIEAAFPGRYKSTHLASIGRHVISSWAQSGHLEGRATKRRARATSGPASTAYALLLGSLCGERGTFLLNTPWVGLLEAAAGAVDAYAFSASQRGWLDYRRIGDVVDIGFAWLARPCEEETSG